MTTRTTVQEESLMAAQWLPNRSVSEMNDRYLYLQQNGIEPNAYPVSGDLTAKTRYLDSRGGTK